jgi:ABC-type Zn uptake system ZnuABC Zn-binding protein ZnuA
MSRWSRYGVSALALLLLFSGLLLTGCRRIKDDDWEQGKSPRVMASFPPIYCFAVNVAGDLGTVKCLLTTTGPHDYQFAAPEAVRLRSADLFLINGLGLDDVFAGKLVNNSGNARLKPTALGERLTAKLTVNHKGASGAHDHGHHHDHGEFDPHAWLGVKQAQEMVNTIRDELSRVDPANANVYKENAANYNARLDKLRDDGCKLLQPKPYSRRKLVAMHDSLGYFAKEFDINLVGSIQAQPGIEADAHGLAALMAKCKAEKVKVIAVEPQYPTTAANLLRKGVGDDVKVITIDPLETAEFRELTPDFYETKMRANLQALVEALP